MKCWRNRARLPARAARPAHRVCGHRRSGEGDQRSARRSRPGKTLGPSGGTALPGHRRSARCLAGGYLPEAKGLRPVGHQWSPQSHAIKNFLASSLVPYRWLDVRTRRGCARPARGGTSSSDELPVVFFEDGLVLRDPDPRRLAERLGRFLFRGPRSVRFGDCRRRSSRVGGSSLRRFGGSANTSPRPPGSRRAGRHQRPY